MLAFKFLNIARTAIENTKTNGNEKIEDSIRRSQYPKIISIIDV